ncbi:MAG: type II toxin-antitoxin system VapC family toxin [Planctomycetes bacterium]|nr:type II toxin-antitoxin system VapC family toxin [Planctomycetota bacterium]
MLTVYIETTIPSYYHETRRTPTILAWRAATRLWWDNYRHEYALLTSQVVLAELAESPKAKAKKAIRLLKDVSLLTAPAGMEEVVRFYIDHHLMPAETGGDAAHLALASMHGVDFLLTWNCRHLANVNKWQHLSVLNARLGLRVPIVTTPLTLLPEAD